MNSCDEILNKAFILTNVGIFEKYITSTSQYFTYCSNSQIYRTR